MEMWLAAGKDLLSAVMESVIEKLASRDLLKYARDCNILDEIKNLKDKLTDIYAVLDGAEEQLTEPLVEKWVNDLRNLAYDVEDVVDELDIEAQKRKKETESQASSSKVQKVVSDFVVGVSSVKFSAQMVARVEEITGKVKEILDRKNQLGLREIPRWRTERLPTSSVVNEAQIHGREKDREEMLERMKLDARDGRTPVIPIVGMGGVGKTTLAQLIYNDPSLEFKSKAWVTVSETFDVLTITMSIVQQLGGGGELKDLNSLQVKLKEILSVKNSLVVLDDVWIKQGDYNKWDLFYSPFVAGTPGSRIIVTTRNHVSLFSSATTGYSLDKLSKDDCLSILANHALERNDFNEHRHLKKVGEEIVDKCNGLPLAAKALGGILRGNLNISSWRDVLNSKIWEERNIVLPALKLSYYHLPLLLKRCFSYTAIFPKDYKFRRTQLVSLWMAEGFVMKIKDGYMYFDDLLARSFFQKSSSDEPLFRSFLGEISYDEPLFVMHDLIVDLARSVSGNICFNLDEEAEKSYVEVRHSAFTCLQYDFAPRFERFYEMKHLRTFLGLKHGQYRHCYISLTVLDVMIERLKYLRVLALPYLISKLPASIDCLKHLRYLDLSTAHIEMLPESLCKLFNLKALILFNCRNLRKLPENFCNLINLQFLDIRDTRHLEELPPHIGELKNLHILGKIVVGKIDGFRMLELFKIPNLQGQQHISELQNVMNVQDVESWEMRKLEGMEAIKLEWSNKFDNCRNEKNEEEVLSALKPQKNIVKLSIQSYGGRELPSWIGDPLFGKMKILILYNCHNVASLPALGQLPSLEELTLQDMKGVKEVGMTFYENVPFSANLFPSLKILRIWSLENLCEWYNYSIGEGSRQVFRKLKKLDVNDCPKLEKCSFPFSNLNELVVNGCKEIVLRTISNLQSLTKLNIGRISALESFSGAFLEALVSLQEMKVHNCDELKHLWEDEFNVGWLGCLKKLEIWECKEVVSLVKEDEGHFPLNLQHLSVYNCEKLEKLPNQLHSLTSLTHLTVEECRKLKTFPTRGFPYSVKHVSVEHCDSLVNLPEGIIVENIDNSNSGCNAQIEVLTIKGCNAFIVPSNLGFPALRDLRINGLVEAQLFRSLQLQNDFSHLTYLEIHDCPNLESFPDTISPIPTLTRLDLFDCEKLRSLPNHMNQFTSLQYRRMYNCPEVASFPEGGLPTNLKRLSISYCDKLESKVMLEQSLNTLTCLEMLRIEVGGGMDDVNSFPHDSLLLPTSLTDLRIGGFRNLKSISSGIQTLTSLQLLSIAECPKLQSLPRVGLPPSLGCLSIRECPLLEEQCRKGKGDFWPLVASIPTFQKIFTGFLKPKRLEK